MPDRDQVAEYAKRKGMALAEVERWLEPSLADSRGSNRRTEVRRWVRRLQSAPHT